MKLHVDALNLLATCEPGPDEASAAASAPPCEDLDLRKLPFADGTFAAIELDDVPVPGEWTVSGPALAECRRVLKRHGLLEVRTRRLPGDRAQATERETTSALIRVLQNHGFEVVSVDPVEDGGSLVAALALRGDGPDDVFDDQIAATASHLTLHGPMLDASDDAARNRALAATLDEHGVKIRVRVIFEVLDGHYCD